MTSICHGLLALMWLLFAPTASADGIAVATLNSADHRLHETHEPEVNVSGNVIVGVMATSAGAGLAADLLGMRTPEPGKLQVCLRVTSRDGAYMSRNEYSVELAEATVFRLPYDSTMRDVLDSYATQDGAIAVSATAGDCAAAATAGFYVPAKLDPDNAALDAGTVTIFINGFDATDVYYQVTGTGPDDIIDCHYIEEGRHTAYNFSCVVPVELLDDAGTGQIEISREIYGRELDPVTVRLLSTR